MTEESADAPCSRSGVTHCVFCGTPFTPENYSRDHVFPELIGGRRTVDFVCRDCNSRFGKTFEADLGRNAFVHAAKAQLKWDGSPHLTRQKITGKSQTGDKVKIVVKRGSDTRQIIASRQPDGRVIDDDESTKERIVSELRKRSWSDALIRERFLDRFEAAPNGIAIPIVGACLAFMRHKDWPLRVTYEDMGAPFRWALVAKIAIEVYLAAGFAHHDIPIMLIPMDFDEVRAAVLANEPNRLSVWCPNYGQITDVSSVPYQPFHSVTYGVSGDILSAVVCLFGVLRFAVCLGRVLYPDVGDRGWEFIFPLRNTGVSQEVEFYPLAADSIDRYKPMMGTASVMWCGRHGLL